VAVVAGLTALAGLTGCSDAVRVPVPTTTGAAAAQCRALQARLPQTLMGVKRRSSSPASADTAAWGDPPITLRCGVPEPAAMNPASPQYDPKETQSVAEESDGVCWLSQPTDGGGFRFTTVKQQTYVEVDVPGAYQGQSYPLPTLAPAVLKADPVNPDTVFDCL
jgi:Protein of unknown function (DUF3515)